MEPTPARYAGFSVAASLATLALKFGAFFATGSVGLLSDATESLVNLSAGLMALAALIIAARPADSRHSYGHGKVEYFSSGIEGLLILVAAVGIIWAAVGRFLSPQPLAHLGPGLIAALAASGINLGVARLLMSAARRYDSITLEADARHLMTDVWTSVGLVAGLGVLLIWPEWTVLDPIIAVIMALNIIHSGVDLMRRSVGGLMDSALPETDIATIEAAIDRRAPQAHYHKLRTRKAGSRRFVDFHLLVPGSTSVLAAHDLCCDIEAEIEAALPRTEITIHVEPLEEEALERGAFEGKHCPQDAKDSGEDGG